MNWESLMKDMAEGTQIGELPSVPPAEITTGQLFMLLVAQNARIGVLTRQVAAMVDAQRDMAEAWRTAGNVLKFVKWLAALGAAGLFLWGMAKNLFTATPPGQGPA